MISGNNFVNKTNLVHKLFLVYLSISTCFGRLFAYQQENNCVYAGAYAPAYQTAIHTEITSTKCRINTVVLLLIGK